MNLVRKVWLSESQWESRCFVLGFGECGEEKETERYIGSKLERQRFYEKKKERHGEIEKERERDSQKEC